MERYSILDPGFTEPPLEGEWVRQPVQEQRSEELRFPGEDGGESLALWARRDLEATLQLLADRAQYITGASGAAIALRDGEQIICRASSGPSAPQVGSYLEVSSGLSGESVRTRETLRCDDASCDPRVNYASCRRLGIRSFLVMPLLRNDEVIGIFEVFSGKPHSFKEHDYLALERMAEMVNTALDQVKHARPKPVQAGLADESLRLQNSEPEPSGQTITPLVPGELEVQAEASDLQLPSSFEKGVKPEAPLEMERPQTDEGQMQEASCADTAAKPSVEPGRGKDVTSMIRRCSACGFPVSEARTLCLDCEKSAPQDSSSDTIPDAAHAPVFLADLSSQKSQPPGVKQWLIAHKYLIGTVLVLGSTIVFLLIR